MRDDAEQLPRTIRFKNGMKARRLAYGGAGKCRGCGTAPGDLHGPACGLERCPICGDALRLCPCGASEYE